MLGRPILTQDKLNAHLTQLGDIQDVIWAPLYDANTYGSSGVLTLSFFALPQGQGTTSAPSATGTKTLADTNLQAAGQLTKGNAFYCTGKELVFFPGVNPGTNQAFTLSGNFINDTYVLGKSGVVTLTIGSNRTYIQDGPLNMFPPATRLAMASALGFGGVTTAVEVTYAAWSGEQYSITPVYIEATLGFQVVLTWPALVPLPSTVNGRLFSRLRGYLNRNAQ
jgi:hypothetical protein